MVLRAMPAVAMKSSINGRAARLGKYFQHSTEQLSAHGLPAYGTGQRALTGLPKSSPAFTESSFDRAFNDMDTNQNGQISREAARFDGTAKNSDAADSNQGRCRGRILTMP